MCCQLEFHRQPAVIWVDLGMGHRLNFRRVLLEIGIQRVNRIGDVIIGGKCCESDIKTEDLPRSAQVRTIRKDATLLLQFVLYRICPQMSK